jgi:large repetitive protein
VYRARLDWVVYKDIAADGSKSVGDTWIAWQTVTLKTSTWLVIATGTTSSTGWYSFDNLMPDTYTVSYANSTNFLPYNIHSWSVGWTTSWFQSMTVVINPSDNAVNNDIYNSGDPLLSWMTVTLQWTTVRWEIVTLTTTTDNSWSYVFDKLTPGTYKVHYSNTNPNYFHDSAQVWINNSVLGTVASYQQIDSIWITVWDHAINYNFGLIDIAFGSRLWGIVYTDLDMSSRQTSGDSIYPWATVILQGTPTTWASFVRTTTTDSQGQYLFTNLPQGTYTVTLSWASIDNRYQAYASNAWTVSGNTTWQGTTEWWVSSFMIQNAYLGNNDTSINNNFGLISMDLTTQITCTPQLLNPGLSSVCTVTYANLWNRTATWVDVTFTLWSGLNFVGANPSLTNLTLTQWQTGSITFTVSTPTETWYIWMNIPVTTTITSATPELNIQTNTDTDLIAIQDWNMVSIAWRVYLDKDSSWIYGSGETYTSW